MSHAHTDDARILGLSVQLSNSSNFRMLASDKDQVAVM